MCIAKIRRASTVFRGFTPSKTKKPQVEKNLSGMNAFDAVELATEKDAGDVYYKLHIPKL